MGFHGWIAAVLNLGPQEGVFDCPECIRGLDGPVLAGLTGEHRPGLMTGRQSEEVQNWIPVSTNRAGDIFTQPVDPSRSRFIRVRTL